MNNIPYSYEIILINDGSTDSTLNKINKYVNTSNIKIISYKNNRQTLTLQLNNILDETHYNHLSKIKFIAPEPGRNLVVSYKLLF